jgi:hypothetical protein
VIAQDGESLIDWLAAFRTIQAAEAWRAHGDWITSSKPEFGPGIRSRFEAASQVTTADVTAAKAARTKWAPVHVLYSHMHQGRCHVDESVNVTVCILH